MVGTGLNILSTCPFPLIILTALWIQHGLYYSSSHYTDEEMEASKNEVLVKGNRAGNGQSLAPDLSLEAIKYLEALDQFHLLGVSLWTRGGGFWLGGGMALLGKKHPFWEDQLSVAINILCYKTLQKLFDE